MAKSINSVFFSGNLGRDIEIHTFENGDKQGKVSLAVSEKIGEKDHSFWIELIVPDHIAKNENRTKFLTKGKQVHVEGKLRPRDYEKDGVKRMALEMRVDDFTLMGSPEKAAE